MGDLISRSESIRRLKVMTNIEVIREGIETAIAIIETQEDAKTVDAEPVKRARWKKPSYVLFAMPICSACGEMGYFNWVACPHCGARMDGGD